MENKILQKFFSKKPILRGELPDPYFIIQVHDNGRFSFRKNVEFPNDYRDLTRTYLPETADKIGAELEIQRNIAYELTATNLNLERIYSIMEELKDQQVTKERQLVNSAKPPKKFLIGILSLAFLALAAVEVLALFTVFLDWLGLPTRYDEAFTRDWVLTLTALGLGMAVFATQVLLADQITRIFRGEQKHRGSYLKILLLSGYFILCLGLAQMRESLSSQDISTPIFFLVSFFVPFCGAQIFTKISELMMARKDFKEALTELRTISKLLNIKSQKAKELIKRRHSLERELQKSNSRVHKIRERDAKIFSQERAKILRFYNKLMKKLS